MMSRAWLRHCGQGARFCGACALTILLWALWLALGVLLAGQIGIATSKELAVPAFLLRSLEQRLAASHLTLRFGHAAFDPTGRVLITEVRLNLPEFEEPIATARSVYIELDPWSLLVGRFNPAHVRVTGLNVFVPAMLAPSGRNEELLHELEIVATPGPHEIQLDHFAGTVAGVPLSVHGRFTMPAPKPGARPLPLASLLTQHYAAACRQLVAAADRIAWLQDPSLEVALSASANRGAIATIHVSAASAQVPGAHPVKATGLRAETRLPVLGDTPSAVLFSVEADAVESDLAQAHRVHLRVRAALRKTAPWLEPREVELSARDLSSREFTLGAPVGRASGSLQRARAEIFATYADLPVAVSGTANLAQRSGSVRVDAELPPSLIDPISRMLQRDLRRFISFGEPASLHARATFAPGWDFTGAKGRFAARKIDGHGVFFDSVTGEFEGDRHHVLAHHLIGHVGENFARGSYEQSIPGRDYRFLLEGRLRPMDIGPWFHDWWPNFFRQLEFPAAPPSASVEVAGRWGEAHGTQVFVAAFADHPVLRGVQFDYVRTLLFIRPDFLDGLELHGTRGAAELDGSFQRRYDFAANEWRSLDLDFRSTLDLPSGRQLLGPAIGDLLTPFVFERPPQVAVKGHFDGPAAPGGAHHHLKIDSDSTGAFTLYDFPFRNVAFTGTLDDGDLTLQHVEAGVASGTITGTVKLWTAPTGRRLGFDAALRNASLAEAVRTVETFVAHRRGEKAPATERFLAGKSAVKLDAALSAEGAFDDVYSYHGTGNALISGSELGEVQLLGGLSQLLNFTALRFTSARTNYELAGPLLRFPNVNITGANSAIEGHGTYRLDTHQLDFNARVFPFRESKSFLQSVVGTVLTPLSSALEVKLTGALEEPDWAFVIGPTNLFRSLTQPGEKTDEKPKPDDPRPYLTR